MNDLERKYLLAVERGDLNTLKDLLNTNQTRRPNINCCDPLARNALVIAIHNENLQMVKILIEAGIKISDEILYAIDENFVEAVELLLDYEEMNMKSGNPHSWEQNRENSTFSADMTPLILAAHRNNFEVIKILLDRRVSPIPDPHDPKCDCSSCYKARLEDCLKHSRSRINAYRALASPCLMALSSPDPLLTAFEMSAKLESLANMEPEYKNDYLKLRAQCQTFATKLLDHTRTSKELEIILNYSYEYLDDHRDNDNDRDLYCQSSFYEMSSRNTYMSTINSLYDTNTNVTQETCDTPCDQYASINGSDMFGKEPNFSPLSYSLLSVPKCDPKLSIDSVTGKPESYRSHMRLACLRLAIQCKQKTFCAHPNIQELLATMWYENLPGFRRKNPISQCLQVILIGLMFPIYSIAYLIAPETQLGRYIKKPFIKFICHSASYITFLIVLILASQRVEAFYSWNSLSGLFSAKNSQIFNTNESDFTILKQMPKPLADTDDSDIKSMATFYQNLNARGVKSTSRSLDGLTKIFEQLPASSKKRGSPPSPIELVILLWVLSLIWAEVKQLRALGMNYYKADMWNTLDSVASGFYIGTIILRVISYMQADENDKELAREHWHAYDPTLLSEGLFAAATIFSALKLVYIFSVNPYLGPLQISLGRMIIDILRFSWIYMLVLFSFSCGMNQLLWYYADLERHQCLNITNYNLAQYYSAQHEHQDKKLRDALERLSFSATTSTTMSPGFNSSNFLNNTSRGILKTTESPEEIFETFAPTLTPLPLLDSDQNVTDEKLMEAAFRASMEDDSTKPPVTLDDSCKTWRYFSNVFESSQTLFWATFGLVDLENFDLTGIRQYTRFWALLMFGCYCFINVIVVLNLLIAMMNHSYVKISKKSDIEWKFARTRLWMSYFDTGSTVPAPFNIIPSIKSITFCILLMWNCVVNFFCGLHNRKQRRKQQHHQDLHQKEIQLKQKQQTKNLLLHRRSVVVRTLVRRYLVNEQRLVERKRELTEAKLNRWAKLMQSNVQYK